MKKFTLLFVALISLGSLNAQNADSVSWERKGSFGFNFANVGLSNWAGGGESSVALGGVYNSAFIRTTGSNTWKTSIDFALGGAKVGEGEFRKTDDAIILLSQYTKKINENLGWGLTGVLRTQLLEGNTFAPDGNGGEIATKISSFMAPGYLTVNLGMDYIKGDVFSLSFSPAAGKFTFVSDDDLSDAGAFGVTPGDKVRAEFGSNLLATLSLKLAENMAFQSNVNFFTSYETFGTIDVNWETLLVMKVNEWFNATFGTQLIYDKDIRFDDGNGGTTAELQFKHVLNVGVNFALFNGQ
ncbi:MAG: DUF3078 domain-containing protein [Roseivirga sp.]|nr:DUF3078 domain-containing protein [Roseivirga sp.]